MVSQVPCGLVIIDRDVGARDDSLNDTLAVWTLAIPVSLECLDGLLKGEPIW